MEESQQMKLVPFGIFAMTFLVSFSVQADKFLTANLPVNEAPVAVTPTPANTAAPINAAAEINSVPVGVTCTVSNVEAINSVVATAQTPQQAARLFAKIVSPAIGQAVANAVQQVLARTQSRSPITPTTPGQPSSNSLIQGWQLIIVQNGLAVQLHWPSPGLSTAGNLPVALLQARAAPTLSGALLPVTVSGTF
jgi:hypothetical protein